jgi:ABC-type cobalamin/Fe3+-siderophores transport system ATPase subunit
MVEPPYLIQNLELSGFRAYLQPKAFDFTKKRCLAIFAPNGSGKSSMIDGLEFMFSKDGTLERLGIRTINNNAGVIALAHTDAELSTYKRSPDTFFGVVKEVQKEIQEPLDCYDFFWQVYSKSTREKLLEFVSKWSDYSLLEKLDQKELAENYCARMAEMMWSTYLRDGAVKNPTTVNPLIPR